MLVGLVLLVGGLAMIGYAGYLQYASLPEEHTMGQGSRRLALALGGLILLFVGSQLLADGIMTVRAASTWPPRPALRSRPATVPRSAPQTRGQRTPACRRRRRRNG